MREVTFEIDRKIFELSPNYRRAIVIAKQLDNTVAAPLLNKEIADLTHYIKATVTNKDARIATWRAAFKAANIKPGDYRPSVDALVRRILNDKPLGSISPIVDIGTIISLRYLLPAGAHPLLEDSTNVTLTITHGDEFIESRDGMSETIPDGEIVLLDTGRVATRRWVWRQTNISRIDNATSALYMNIDALECIDEPTLKKAIEDTERLLSSTFDAQTKTIILDSKHPKQIVVV